MQFRLLGPLEIEFDGQPLPVPRRRERCLLGILLLNLDRVVSADRLAELLWDDDPPQHARPTLHTHVSRLRAALRAVPGRNDVELSTVGDGYRIRVQPQSVDAHRFRALLDQAAGTSDLAVRIDQLGAALNLWRGPVLGNAASDYLRDRLCRDLEEQRLTAAEEYLAAGVALRRERELLPELTRIVVENPGREDLIALHMRALYQAGRRADALGVFDRARRHLAEELGLDPGPVLRELHQAILRDELVVPSLPPALSTAAVGVAAGPEPAPRAPDPVVPRQLPAAASGFTGRGTYLAQLDALLPGADDPAPSMVISAISGPAGVGKTALAVQAAHRVADRCPDGQLFIDLHGFTAALAPVEPGDALARLLWALGVPGERIPVELEDRAALWRSTLAGRRMVVVLDNAANEAQVTPLLPGAPGCLVLVTSRRRLAGLEATHAVSLDMLPLPDALTMFARTVGPARITPQPPGTPQSPGWMAEIVELCGRLPLAIRIAAGRLRSHPAWSEADLAERLRDEDQRLAELDDGSRGVAAALEVSYRQLSAEQQRLYRLLGLHPGADIHPYAVAALAGTTVARARRLLDQLLDAHLLQEPVAGRYVFHDLVCAHAADTAIRDEAEPQRRAALDRLLDHYRHTASVAMDAAYPYERDRRPEVPPAGSPAPPLPDAAVATGWLDLELPNLLAAAQRAADDGCPGHTWQLSTILHRHLRTRGRYREAENLHDQALTTARTAGNRAAELDALTRLGWVLRMRGRHGQAIDLLGHALEIARATGDRAGELGALTVLGDIHWRQGRREQAIELLGRALEIAQTIGHRAGELDALTSLGHVHLLQDRHEQAIEHFGRALETARSIGHRDAELDALTGLGYIHWLRARHEQAAGYFGQVLQVARSVGHRIGEQNALTGLARIYLLQDRHEEGIELLGRALEIARTIGNRSGELSALLSLGHTHRQRGRPEQAADYYRQVMDIAVETGDRNGQFEAAQGLGRAHHAIGHPEAALAYHRRALELVTDLQQLTDQARAHDGLAHSHHTLHQHEQAREHWQRALDILVKLGVDHTEDGETSAASIGAHLAALPCPPVPDVERPQ